MHFGSDSVRLLARGRWSEQQVSVTPVVGTRRHEPDVEAAIEVAWRDVNARPGVRLFDGPVCRLESFSASPALLHLHVSQTSYRINVGTNFCHPEFAEQFGREVMANPQHERTQAFLSKVM